MPNRSRNKARGGSLDDLHQDMPTRPSSNVTASTVGGPLLQLYRRTPLTAPPMNIARRTGPPIHPYAHWGWNPPAGHFGIESAEEVRMAHPAARSAHADRTANGIGHSRAQHAHTANTIMQSRYMEMTRPEKRPAAWAGPLYVSLRSEHFGSPLARPSCVDCPRCCAHRR